MFPVSRPRRLRSSQNIRDLVAESAIKPEKLIMPVFVDEGAKKAVPIRSMPGIYRYPLSELEDHLISLQSSGVRSILLFGIPVNKDEVGSSAYDENGIVQKAIGISKERTDLITIADLCMCEYTSHGHCGMIEKGVVDNDTTLEVLAETAVSHARAGADMVAPSAMMDGQIAAIREGLDEQNFESIPIMAYSAKYASCFYGPFREAAQSTPQFGDRRDYQMDPANGDEAIREITLDVSEGADIIMVKPALAYLDIICRAKQEFDLPLAAYNVSGEYSMIKAAAQMGWLDEEKAMLESLTAIKRAGADIIITYWAIAAAKVLNR